MAVAGISFSTQLACVDQQVGVSQRSTACSSVLHRQAADMAARHLKRMQQQQAPAPGLCAKEEEEEEEDIMTKPFNPFDLLSDDEDVSMVHSRPGSFLIALPALLEQQHCFTKLHHLPLLTHT